MEIILGILAAFLQFNFFSIPFFAGIFYVLYHDFYLELVGIEPKFSLLLWKMLPPLGSGLDGAGVFWVYLFFILFVLLMGYHIINYWPFWSVIGVLFLGIALFRIVSGMGGVSSFLMFILKIGGILLAIALVLLLLFVGSLIIWDRKETKKYEKKLRREKAVEEWKNGASV